MLVAVWPLTDDCDRDLAYLASYPEFGRTPTQAAAPHAVEPTPSWAVVLHLPGFATRHAAAHDNPHLHVITGPALPAEPPQTRPSPRHVRQPDDLDDNPAAPETQLAGDAPR